MAELLKGQIVDTHFHLWDKGISSQTWLKPDPDFWFRTFAPTDLEDAATNIGLGTCVAIEAGRTTRENHALGQWANNFSLIGAFIPYIDLESHDLGQQLDAWQEHAKFRGVRMGFEGHADPGILQKVSILEGLREIARRELIFEFLVLPTHLHDLLMVLEKVPQLQCVIEHMAKPGLKNTDHHAIWHQQMQLLAKHTAVPCKLSLSPQASQVDQWLQERGQHWPPQAIRTHILFMLEHFGADRLMWGSDWPVCLMVDNYENTWLAIDDCLADVTHEDKRKIYCDTALDFYRPIVGSRSI